MNAQNHSLLIFETLIFVCQTNVIKCIHFISISYCRLCFVVLVHSTAYIRQEKISVDRKLAVIQK